MIGVQLWVFTCVNLFFTAKCSVPNEKLCVNAACTEPISRAQGSVKYISPSRELLSFKPGKEIIITSKSKNKQDYWGAVIDGKHGYVPSNLIKETQVFHSTDKLITVPVEDLQSNATVNGILNESSLPQTNNSSSQINTVPLVSGKNDEPVLKFLPESIPSASEEIKKSLAPEKENANENSPEKSLNADLFVMSDLKQKENDLSPTEVYSVIEGTTVYVYGNEEEITPSPTLDLKVNVQTSLIKDLNVKITPESHKNEINSQKNQIKTELFSDAFQTNVKYKEELALLNNKETNLENESVESKGENTQIEKKKHIEDINIHSSDIYDDDDDDDDEDEDEEDDDDDDDGGGGESDNVDVDDQNNDDNNNHYDGNPNSDNDVDESYDVHNKNANVKSDKTENKVLENEQVMTSNMSDDFPDKMQVMQVSSQSNLGNSGSVPTEANNLKASKIEESKTESVTAVNEEVHTDQKNIEVVTGVDENNAQVQKDISQILFVPPPVQQDNLGTNSPSEHIENSDGWNMINDFNERATQGFVKSYTSKSDSDNITISEISISSDENITHNPEMEKKNPDEELEDGTSPKNSDKSQETTEGFEHSFPLAENSVEQMDKKVKQQTLDDESSNVVKESTPTPNFHSNKILKEATYQHESVQEDQSILLWFTGFFSNLISNNKEIIKENEATEKILLDTEIVQNEWRERESGFDESLNNNILTETRENCDSNSGCSEVTKDEPGLFFLNFNLSSELPASSNTFLYLIVTAVTVLVFTLGHNFIEKKGKTGPLIAKINKLEQELLVTSKECFLLKDEIRNSKEKIILYENSANDELVVSLQTELEESKRIRSELESSIEILQQELDAATEAGLDLNKMLSEVLTQKGGSESLLKSVENLQAQLDSQQKVIDEMTNKLGIKNQENERLQDALQLATEKAGSLEDQLNDIKYNLNLHLKEKEDLTQNLNSQISQLQIRINQLNESKEKEVSKAQKNVEEIQKKLKETTQALTIKEEEFKSLKESIKQIKTKGNANLQHLFDVSRIKAELIKEKKENQELLKNWESEVNLRNNLEDQIKSLNFEVRSLKINYDDAEQKRDEAEKKLEVLSTYFKEKETQLQKELGLQEALWAQKMGDEKTVNNIIKSLQEEVDSYKSQNETLKKEILDQERGLKNQIAVLEQKAHENWVAARQAERKLEEIKQETAQLRSRLTLMEKSVNNDAEGKANHRTSEELNGIEANSPILHDTSSPLLFPPLPMDPNNSTLLPPGFMPHPMFMPPPMGGFIPPPPFLPGDRRPPPLGRMSSPPLNSRFSPPSLPDYSFERMPSPPLSPSTRNFRSPNEADRDREHFRHRTPPYPMLPKNWDDGREIAGFIPISSPRDSRREQKGSNVSSGHSSSDSLDKSSRNSGRV